MAAWFRPRPGPWLGARAVATLFCACLSCLCACSSEPAPASDPASTADGGGGSSGAPPTSTEGVAPAGNPEGRCAIPPEAAAESVQNPRTIVGSGTPASCTSSAFVAAVAKGGVITFDCGDAPATITLSETAKVHNDTGPVVIDGGGKVTLSGGGLVRILYMNACDPENGGWASGAAGDCNEQVTPELTIQNVTLADGDVRAGNIEKGGGGAVYARGGRLKIVNARFFHNACDELGSDVGGGAVRVLDFPKGGSVARPVYVVNSTFGGEGALGNACANGGALSSIGASWSIYNSVFSGNRATGHGANDGDGGNGGALYNDGNTMALSICGSILEHNRANEGGSAIFFVSNDRSGTIAIADSTLRDNPKGTFETAGYPGLFVLADGPPKVTGSTLE